jgi:hypothetical protein
MPQNISLEDLILGYCRQVDGLVEPPAYGAYEVLLPDDIAARWGLPAHQRMAFLPETEQGAEQGRSTYIHFGHPLVETVVDELRAQTANGRFFINNVRPEKPKLYEVIEKAFALPNAKMFPVPGAQETVSLHHYARLNFKVSLIADEKRELLLPLWMDLQGGFAVKPAEIEHLAILDDENAFPNTPTAPLTWSKESPLSPQALADLLERARLSAASAMGETLDSLQKRLTRFLELDRARLNDYYDDLHKDTSRRLDKAEEDRRSALEAKLAAIAGERASKLADVEQKYHLHIQLELVNLALIAQPKLDLTVEIRKRGLAVKRRVSWDPLLHAVEGLACDACGQSGLTLFLCENGHLAHAECLAPQCVDCKRTFCQKCAGEVQTCVVCERPVCVHSLNKCKECGRGTCQEHVGLCHAEAGQPRKVAPEAAQGVAPSPKITEASAGAKVPAPQTGKSAKEKAPVKREAPKSKTLSPKTHEPAATGEFIEVYSDPAQNSIMAIVKTKKHEVATREWIMADNGIATRCWCEKTDCREKGTVYRPTEADGLLALLTEQIEKLAMEYGVPVKKIHFFHVRQGQPFAETKLKIPVQWKEPETLARAWAGFEELRKRNRGW